MVRSEKLFDKIIQRRSPLPQEIVAKLVSLIKDGELKPGDRLPPISQLAHSFGVGHGTVREALNRMAAWSIIRIEHGKGIFVGQADVSSIVQVLTVFLTLERTDLAHLMEVRKALEVEVTKLASERATDEEIAQLLKIIERKGFKSGSADEFVLDDFAFHMKLAEICRNPLYRPFIQSIRYLFLEEQKSVIKLPGALRTLNNHHKKICEAVRNHSIEEAARAMNSHLTYVENQILSQVK